MNNDLISRSALLAEYCEGCDALVKRMCDQDVCGVAMMINDAPAVDVAPVVHGEWIATHKEKIVSWQSCSKCGSIYPPNCKRHYNFCPNCGADMRERKGGGNG